MNEMLHVVIPETNSVCIISITASLSGEFYFLGEHIKPNRLHQTRHVIHTITIIAFDHSLYVVCPILQMLIIRSALIITNASMLTGGVVCLRPRRIWCEIKNKFKTCILKPCDPAITCSEIYWRCLIGLHLMPTTAVHVNETTMLRTHHKTQPREQRIMIGF